MSKRAEPGLPSNVDAERFVLGSILVDNAFYGSAAAVLSPDSFALEKHRRIWRRMGDLNARGTKIDPLTVYNELADRGEAEACDGLSYLVELDDGLPRVPNLDSYLKILEEKAIRRRVLYACKNLSSRCTSTGENAADIVAAAQDLFAGLSARTAGNATYRSIAEIPSVRDCGANEVNYIDPPILARGCITALTGDSASGKSTKAAALARNAWRRHGIPALFLDRENPVSVVSDRLTRLGIEDGPGLRFWGGWLPQEAPLADAPVIVDWIKTCEPRPLIVVDSLSAFFVGDQNDATEMRKFLHRCRRVADLGAAVLLLHHDGKAETARDFRGSSDFKAAIDIAFHVSNFGDGGRLDKIVLRCFKSRFGFAGELVYHYADGQFLLATSVEATQTITEQLTVILRLNPAISGKRFEELAHDRSISREQARQFLAAGLTAATVRRETGPNNSKRYFLAGREGSK